MIWQRYTEFTYWQGSKVKYDMGSKYAPGCNY